MQETDMLARVMTSGMVKARKILQWVIRSQAPKQVKLWEKVQRLGGGRFQSHILSDIII
jgi:hypothetical protein